MRRVLLAAAFVLAPGESKADALLTALVEGRPPTLDPGAMAEVREELSSRLFEIEALLQFEGGATGNCARFRDALVGTARSIRDTAAITEPKYGELARARLYLLIPSFVGLQQFVAAGREGGYGVLTPGRGTECPFRERARLRDRLAAAAQMAGLFMRDGLGAPGLLGLDEMMDRLLERSTLNADTQARKSWALLGGALVVSILFWELTPPAAVWGARALFGSVPEVLSGPWAIVSLRSGALAAEAFAYQYAEARLLPPEIEESHSPTIGTWDDQIAAAEALSASRLDSPELYFVALSQVKSQIGHLYQGQSRKMFRDAGVSR